MQAVGFIKNIPQHFISACQAVPSVVKKVEEKCQAILASLGSSDLWIQLGKPFYERHVKPLDKLSTILLAGSLLTAAFATAALLDIFGCAGAPIAAAINIFLIAGTYSLCQHRIRKQSDIVAWDLISLIRTAVHEIDIKKPDFATIEKEKCKLLQSQFSHLQPLLNEFEEKWKKFKEDAIKNPQSPHSFQERKLLISYLGDLLQKIDPAKLIPNLDLDEIEEEENHDNDI